MTAPSAGYSNTQYQAVGSPVSGSLPAPFEMARAMAWGPYQMAVPNSLAQTVVAAARMGQRHAPMNSPGRHPLFWRVATRV